MRNSQHGHSLIIVLFLVFNINIHCTNRVLIKLIHPVGNQGEITLYSVDMQVSAMKAYLSIFNLAIILAFVSFPNLKTYADYQVPGLFSYNVRIRRSKSKRLKRGLYPKEIVAMVNQDNEEEDIKKIADLENLEETLVSLWQDLGFNYDGS